MHTRLMTAALVAFATAASLSAQAPQTPTPAAQPSDRQAQTADVQRPNAAPSQVITIAGCLKEEKDVPGLKPNIAERVGVGDDYILTGVKMAASSQVSGIALADQYEVEGIAESELKKHLNHQVEITGTITQAAATDDDRTADFRGTGLKMIAASCQ